MFLDGMYIWRGTFGARVVVAREVFLFLMKDLIGLRQMKMRRASRSRVIAKKGVSLGFCLPLDEWAIRTSDANCNVDRTFV
jgi:hypothetical protein